MNFTEFGKLKKWNDDQLIAFIKKNLGMDIEDINLMLAIERGESDGDIVEIDERPAES